MKKETIEQEIQADIDLYKDQWAKILRAKSSKKWLKDLDNKSRKGNKKYGKNKKNYKRVY